MGAIQDIFRDHAGEYLRQYGDAMATVQKKAIDAILSCRSSSQGLVVYACEDCGGIHQVYRSCGNRHCPTCQHQKALMWRDRQLENSLPCDYFMLTFTVPEPLRLFLYRHQQIGYNGLFAAASGAIRLIAENPRHIGGDLPGFFGVLHTWGRTLQYHPHIHFVVPGGAYLRSENRWMPSRPEFFLPVRALSKVFRAKFRDEIAAAGLLDRVDASVWNKEWNVNCQAVGQAERAVGYLSRYVFHTAISDARIVSAENGSVTFRYRKPHSNRPRTMTLTGEEFMGRYLRHVLPSGFMKVRHYGFLHPNSAVKLETVRALVELSRGFDVPVSSEDTEAKPAPNHGPVCPACGGKLVYRGSLLPFMMTPQSRVSPG